MAAAVQSTLQDHPLTPCHIGPIPVFQIGKATLWIGSYSEVVKEPRSWDLMISCLGHNYAPSNSTVLTSNTLPRRITSYSRETPFISIDWPDGGVPAIHPNFWTDLFLTLDENISGDVAVFCMGGHGRSGTALAILASLSGACPEGEDPVKWLRDRYCTKVVETGQQIRYISAITGRKIDEKGSLIYDRDWGPFFAQFEQTHDPLNVKTNAAGDIVWASSSNVPWDDEDDDDVDAYEDVDHPDHTQEEGELTVDELRQILAAHFKGT